MTKTVETVLAWGLFAAVYVLILAIVIAPDLFSADQPVVTVAKADLAGAVATGELTPSWGQGTVLTGNRVPPQTAALTTTQP